MERVARVLLARLLSPFVVPASLRPVFRGIGEVYFERVDLDPTVLSLPGVRVLAVYLNHVLASASLSASPAISIGSLSACIALQPSQQPPQPSLASAPTASPHTRASTAGAGSAGDESAQGVAALRSLLARLASTSKFSLSCIVIDVVADPAHYDAAASMCRGPHLRVAIDGISVRMVAPHVAGSAAVAGAGGVALPQQVAPPGPTTRSVAASVAVPASAATAGLATLADRQDIAPAAGAAAAAAAARVSAASSCAVGGHAMDMHVRLPAGPDVSSMDHLLVEVERVSVAWRSAVASSAPAGGDADATAGAASAAVAEAAPATAIAADGHAQRPPSPLQATADAIVRHNASSAEASTAGAASASSAAVAGAASNGVVLLTVGGSSLQESLRARSSAASAVPGASHATSCGSFSGSAETPPRLAGVQTADSLHGVPAPPLEQQLALSVCVGLGAQLAPWPPPSPTSSGSSTGKHAQGSAYITPVVVNVGPVAVAADTSTLAEVLAMLQHPPATMANQAGATAESAAGVGAAAAVGGSTAAAPAEPDSREQPSASAAADTFIPGHQAASTPGSGLAVFPTSPAGASAAAAPSSPPSKPSFMHAVEGLVQRFAGWIAGSDEEEDALVSGGADARGEEESAPADGSPTAADKVSSVPDGAAAAAESPSLAEGFAAAIGMASSIMMTRSTSSMRASVIGGSFVMTKSALRPSLRQHAAVATSGDTGGAIVMRMQRSVRFAEDDAEADDVGSSATGATASSVRSLSSSLRRLQLSASRRGGSPAAASAAAAAADDSSEEDLSMFQSAVDLSTSRSARFHAGGRSVRSLGRSARAASKVDTAVVIASADDGGSDISASDEDLAASDAAWADQHGPLLTGVPSLGDRFAGAHVQLLHQQPAPMSISFLASRNSRADTETMMASAVSASAPGLGDGSVAARGVAADLDAGATAADELPLVSLVSVACSGLFVAVVASKIISGDGAAADASTPTHAADTVMVVAESVAAVLRIESGGEPLRVDIAAQVLRVQLSPHLTAGASPSAWPPVLLVTGAHITYTGVGDDRGSWMFDDAAERRASIVADARSMQLVIDTCMLPTVARIAGRIVAVTEAITSAPAPAVAAASATHADAVEGLPASTTQAQWSLVLHHASMDARHGRLHVAAEATNVCACNAADDEHDSLTIYAAHICTRPAHGEPTAVSVGRLSVRVGLSGADQHLAVLDLVPAGGSAAGAPSMQMQPDTAVTAVYLSAATLSIHRVSADAWASAAASIASLPAAVAGLLPPSAVTVARSDGSAGATMPSTSPAVAVEACRLTVRVEALAAFAEHKRPAALMSPRCCWVALSASQMKVRQASGEPFTVHAAQVDLSRVASDSEDIVLLGVSPPPASAATSNSAAVRVCVGSGAGSSQIVDVGCLAVPDVIALLDGSTALLESVGFVAGAVTPAFSATAPVPAEAVDVPAPAQAPPASSLTVSVHRAEFHQRSHDDALPGGGSGDYKLSVVLDGPARLHVTPGGGSTRASVADVAVLLHVGAAARPPLDGGGIAGGGRPVAPLLRISNTYVAVIREQRRGIDSSAIMLHINAVDADVDDRLLLRAACPLQHMVVAARSQGHALSDGLTALQRLLQPPTAAADEKTGHDAPLLTHSPASRPLPWLAAARSERAALDACEPLSLSIPAQGQFLACTWSETLTLGDAVLVSPGPAVSGAATSASDAALVPVGHATPDDGTLADTRRAVAEFRPLPIAHRDLPPRAGNASAVAGAARGATVTAVDDGRAQLPTTSFELLVGRVHAKVSLSLDAHGSHSSNIPAASLPPRQPPASGGVAVLLESAPGAVVSPTGVAAFPAVDRAVASTSARLDLLVTVQEVAVDSRTFAESTMKRAGTQPGTRADWHRLSSLAIDIGHMDAVDFVHGDVVDLGAGDVSSAVAGEMTPVPAAAGTSADGPSHHTALASANKLLVFPAPTTRLPLPAGTGSSSVPTRIPVVRLRADSLLPPSLGGGYVVVDADARHAAPAADSDAAEWVVAIAVAPVEVAVHSHHLQALQVLVHHVTSAATAEAAHSPPSSSVAAAPAAVAGAPPESATASARVPVAAGAASSLVGTPASDDGAINTDGATAAVPTPPRPAFLQSLTILPLALDFSFDPRGNIAKAIAGAGGTTSSSSGASGGGGGMFASAQLRAIVQLIPIRHLRVTLPTARVLCCSADAAAPAIITQYASHMLHHELGTIIASIPLTVLPGVQTALAALRSSAAALAELAANPASALASASGLASRGWDRLSSALASAWAAAVGQVRGRAGGIGSGGDASGSASTVHLLAAALVVRTTAAAHATAEALRALALRRVAPPAATAAAAARGATAGASSAPAVADEDDDDDGDQDEQKQGEVDGSEGEWVDVDDAAPVAPAAPARRPYVPLPQHIKKDGTLNKRYNVNKDAVAAGLATWDTVYRR